MSQLNKNISVWRGDNTPPTKFHLWIKSDGSLWLYIDDKWVNKTQSQIDEIYGTPTPSKEFSSLRAIEDNQKVFKNTSSVNITTEDAKVTADVNIASDSDIVVNKDGLYTKVETEFENGILSLKVNGEVRSTHDIGLDGLVESAYYDSSTENIVIVFKLHNGESLKIEISAGNLIDDWEWNQTLSNLHYSDVITLLNKKANGKNIASIVIPICTDKDNILESVEYGEGETLTTVSDFSSIFFTTLPLLIDVDNVSKTKLGACYFMQNIIPKDLFMVRVVDIDTEHNRISVLSINNFISSGSGSYFVTSIPKGTVLYPYSHRYLRVKGTSDNIRHGDITVEDKFNEVDTSLSNVTTLLNSTFNEFKENLECYLFLDYPYPADSDLAKSIEVKKNWDATATSYTIPSDLKWLPAVDMSNLSYLIGGKDKKSELCKIPNKLDTSNIVSFMNTFSYSKFKELDLSGWDFSKADNAEYGYTSQTFTYMENVEKIILPKSNIEFDTSFFTGDTNLTTLIMPEIKTFWMLNDLLNEKGVRGQDLATTIPKLGLGSDEALESFVFTFIDSINTQTTPVNLKVTQELYNLLTTELLQKALDKGITINYKF